MGASEIEVPIFKSNFLELNTHLKKKVHGFMHYQFGLNSENNRKGILR